MASEPRTTTASPVEHELTCPKCLTGALWMTLGPVYPATCEACGWTGDVAELALTGRRRARQFATYPQPEAWR